MRTNPTDPSRGLPAGAVVVTQVVLLLLIGLIVACTPSAPGQEFKNEGSGGKYNYGEVTLPDGRKLPCIFWQDDKFYGGELDYVAGMDCDWSSAK